MPVNHNQPAFVIREISEPNVRMIINSLKNSKAKDAYGLVTMVLKTFNECLSGPITHTVNKSINEGVFSRAWKTAIITRIYKTGGPTEVCNYRPISIVLVMTKIIERYIAEQLTSHLNNSPYKLHPMQFGFRSNHSIETANCFLLENMKSKLDKGGVVGAIFLDLKKAFDTVDHSVLLSKLSMFNFSPWMQSYLEGRTQKVRINGELSSALSCDVGVPQGSILGPLLFSLYINDLPTVYSEAEIQMYTDDTVSYVHAKTKQQAACKLMAVIDHVTHWLNNSCLHLNTKKTVYMFFTKRSTDSLTPDVYVAGEKLTVVSDFKYLGITIDSNLTFKKQIKSITNVIKFNLSNFRHIRNCLTTNAATLCFNAMIMSHLSYCLTS